MQASLKLTKRVIDAAQPDAQKSILHLGQRRERLPSASTPKWPQDV